jgi:hypothetical protein
VAPGGIAILAGAATLLGTVAYGFSPKPTVEPVAASQDVRLTTSADAAVAGDARLIVALDQSEDVSGWCFSATRSP